ncbi:MAG: [protein-PII] uridylyltransferase [Gammaproteobacteria bacterium]|nr:[protein-PII] uridylyltransferase [Gammaproteobacteria bacterium]
MALITGPLSTELGEPTDLSPQGIRTYLKEQHELLAQAFAQGIFIDYLLGARAMVMDRVLSALWNEAGLTDQSLGLFAVGGYGRGELHPFSDIDILILGEQSAIESSTDALTTFTTRLWDFNLDIGHAVRSFEDCKTLARDDITIATSLIESRPISAKIEMLRDLESLAFDDSSWSTEAFYQAKVSEQNERYAKHDDSDNRLEPDIKNAPGGLRDLHTIIWVVRKHFRTTRLITLVDEGLLTQNEFRLLDEAEQFLKRTRFALHMAAGRSQNRLLFDLQATVADMMGFQLEDTKQRIEAFMKQVYRMTLRIGEFNDMLLQNFEETVLRDPSDAVVTEINSRWQIRNQHLELIHPNGFERHPSALLEAFVLLAQNPELKGLRASTTRQMYTARHLIDDAFRNDLVNISYFMELMRYPEKLPEVLRRMRYYGILSRYIPEFGPIMGLMQHDLFHIYTVDAHTLQLIRNITRFYTGVVEKDYPIVTRLTQRLPKIELLYLAALFHDIAKGRGGDHSELGAVDAYNFCKHHRLSEYDARLVSWLVNNHLLMSMTAQRKDISDPDELKAFAEIVGDQRRLDYLLCLTVADITATNPELWTSWRATLLRQLYHGTTDFLTRGLDSLPGRAAYIEETKNDALALVRPSIRSHAKAFWDQWSQEYFVSHSSDELAWHLETLIEANEGETVIALAANQTLTDIGSTQVLVSTPNRVHLFADLTACFSDLGLSVLDAKLHTSDAGRSIDIFIVQHDATCQPVTDSEDQERLLRGLEQAALGQYIENAGTRRTPRAHKYFNLPANVSIRPDLEGKRTLIELIAPDRAGLLTTVGRVFAEFGLDLSTAKIATLGERVEDVFYVTDSRGDNLYDDEFIGRLKDRLEHELNALSGALSDAES